MRKICFVAIPIWFFINIALGDTLARADNPVFSMEKALETIRAAESSGINSCIGDRGKARGAYQIQEATWKRYSQLSWRFYAHDKKESRIVAACIVADIVRHCNTHHAKEYEKNPLRLVALHYNAGINTKMTSEQWHRRTKNKIYKAL